jgi:hypothetical protein
MRRRERLLLIAFGIATASAGGVAAWLVSRPVPPVTVIVKNTSAKAIVSVRLEHERGVEVLEDLARGAAKTTRFKAGARRLTASTFASPMGPSSLAAVDMPRRATSSPKRLVTRPSRPIRACPRATDAVQRHAAVDRPLALLASRH